MAHDIAVGQVVRSLAGHDSDSFYVVLAVQPGRVFLADGRQRKLAKPKAKNVRHIQKTNTIIPMDDCKTDKKLRTLLKPLNQAAGGVPGSKEGGNQLCPRQM